MVNEMVDEMVNEIVDGMMDEVIISNLVTTYSVKGREDPSSNPLKNRGK